jgi:hypothetical protein
MFVVASIIVVDHRGIEADAGARVARRGTNGDRADYRGLARPAGQRDAP